MNSAPVSQSADALPSTSLAPYESDLVGDFFRQVGRLEAAHRYASEIRAPVLKQIQRLRAVMSRENVAAFLEGLQGHISTVSLEEATPATEMVANAQNPLDHLVGDVIGQSQSGRYFIIEFKRLPAGFPEEVDLTVGKPDRAALFGHLIYDEECRLLSKAGHFGAHWTPSGIQLSDYFSLISDERGSRLSVRHFFSEVILGGSRGWLCSELRTYIDCMTAHGVLMAGDNGKFLFGYVTPEGKLVAMTSSEKIFAQIQLAFKRADALNNRSVPTNANTKRPTPGRP